MVALAAILCAPYAEGSEHGLCKQVLCLHIYMVSWLDASLLHQAV